MIFNIISHAFTQINVTSASTPNKEYYAADKATENLYWICLSKYAYLGFRAAPKSYPSLLINANERVISALRQRADSSISLISKYCADVLKVQIKDSPNQATKRQ